MDGGRDRWMICNIYMCIYTNKQQHEFIRIHIYIPYLHIYTLEYDTTVALLILFQRNRKKINVVYMSSKRTLKRIVCV